MNNRPIFVNFVLVDLTLKSLLTLPRQKCPGCVCALVGRNGSAGNLHRRLKVILGITNTLSEATSDRDIYIYYKPAQTLGLLNLAEVAHGASWKELSLNSKDWFLKFLEK